jgi:hypothetical protein
MVVEGSRAGSRSTATRVLQERVWLEGLFREDDVIEEGHKAVQIGQWRLRIEAEIRALERENEGRIGLRVGIEGTECCRREGIAVSNEAEAQDPAA